MFSSYPRLVPSVITSSAVVSLGALVEEVLDLHGEASIDLMVLRPEDADRLGITWAGGDDRISDLMADRYDEVRDGFVELFRAYRREYPSRRVRIAAAATYFPDVSCADRGRREKAVRAVVNTVRLCHHLMDQRDLGMDVVACVEVVCGSLLEPVDTSAGRQVLVKQYTLPAKLRYLVESLQRVCEELAPADRPYALALELEPGATYVLRDLDSLRQVHKAVSRAGLAGHVGLNLDIAHFRIAGVTPTALRGDGGAEPDLTEWIVHSHIADHPLQMHTRDLAIGAFTDVERLPTDLCAYLDLLMARAAHAARHPGGLLFTNSVALELEGCSRMRWVHDSLAHLKRLLRAAEERWRGEARPPAPPA